MNLFYSLYNTLITGIFLLYSPFFFLFSKIKKYQKLEHIGIYKNCSAVSFPFDKRIWMHAVSVGEVNAAFKIIEALFSINADIGIILSTRTIHGFKEAERRIKEDKRFTSNIVSVYAPVDVGFFVTKALDYIKPDVLAVLETEIWPNLFIKAKRFGIKTAILNGRISARSFKTYSKIRPFMKYILGSIDVFSMASGEDAERIKALGASENKTVVSGNAKFDLSDIDINSSVKKDIMNLFGISEKAPVFIAGSIRGKETDMIFDLYEKIEKELPETISIIAPRHITRVERILNTARKRNIRCQLRSDMEGEDRKREGNLVILDSIGELAKIYSVATVVFCGGSLVPLGGHNILEASIWGKPVCYGPFMDDFAEAKRVIEDTGGGIQVRDVEELSERVIYFLKNRDKAEAVGAEARKALTANTGAAIKHAEVLNSYFVRFLR